MPKPKLTVIAERADPDIVKMFEDYLASAKRGEIRSAAVAVASKGGTIGTGSYVWTNDRPSIYLALEKLRSVILDRA